MLMRRENRNLGRSVLQTGEKNSQQEAHESNTTTK